MSNCKKKGGKIKKYEAGGMPALAKSVPEGFLGDAKDRLAKRRRDMMMEGMGRALRETTPPLARKRGGARKTPPMVGIGEAFIEGSRRAREMKDLPKDSAEYARMKKAQEMAGAAMKAAPSRGASGMKKGGSVKMKKGGKVSSCSKRADGCAKRGKTKGRMV